MNTSYHEHRREGQAKGVQLAALCGVLMLVWARPALAQITNGVYLPNSTPYGKTYAQWSAAWWQWANSLETIHHPVYDTADACTGQSGSVWFLGIHLVNDGVTTRSLVMPQGTALFFPIMVEMVDNTGCPTPTTYTEAQLRSIVQASIDQVYSVTCTIDGADVPNLLSSYRFQSPVFDYTDPPNNNLLEASEGEPCYNDPSATPSPFYVTGAVADGFYLMVAPLGLGSHTIHFTAAGGSASEDLTYNITVTDTNLGNPLVFPPDAAPYGKTYSQWAAEYWKWVYSLPVDQSPLFGSVDVSAGQSGSVWFLGGTVTEATPSGVVMAGSTVRAATVPEGKPLFFPLVATESASAEQHGTNYGQLFAAAQFLMDHATNFSCVIDGQPTANLAHYRAQSPLFTWGSLPTNNVFADPVNFPAGLSSSSVADGYFLMLSPLSPGAHTVQFTGGLDVSTAAGDPYDFSSTLDITYNLTVTPVSLTLVRQGTNAVLSWLQTPSNYLLESTPGLAPATWSAVPGPVQTLAGNYQVTTPLTRGNQFFRLRQQ